MISYNLIGCTSAWLFMICWPQTKSVLFLKQTKVWCSFLNACAKNILTKLEVERCLLKIKINFEVTGKWHNLYQSFADKARICIESRCVYCARYSTKSKTHKLKYIVRHKSKKNYKNAYSNNVRFVKRTTK